MFNVEVEWKHVESGIYFSCSRLAKSIHRNIYCIDVFAERSTEFTELKTYFKI